MPRPNSSMGRISDLANMRPRANWSPINARLKALQPGEVLNIPCPSGMKMGSFRSTILTNGNRYHRLEWCISTRTEGNILHCFLSPRPTQ